MVQYLPYRTLNKFVRGAKTVNIFGTGHRPILVSVTGLKFMCLFWPTGGHDILAGGINFNIPTERHDAGVR